MAIFTILMGIQLLKCVILMQGWMSKDMLLVTEGLIVLIKIWKIILTVVFLQVLWFLPTITPKTVACLTCKVFKRLTFSEALCFSLSLSLIIKLTLVTHLHRSCLFRFDKSIILPFSSKKKISTC